MEGPQTHQYLLPVLNLTYRQNQIQSPSHQEPKRREHLRRDASEQRWRELLRWGGQPLHRLGVPRFNSEQVFHALSCFYFLPHLYQLRLFTIEKHLLMYGCNVAELLEWECDLQSMSSKRS